MKRLEIIHPRASGEPLDCLGRRIRESITAQGTDPQAVTLYRRAGLKPDLAVHSRHPAGTGRQGPSDLALRLASALGAYRLVEQTVWEEQR